MKRWYCLRGEEVADPVVVPETCDIADLKEAIHSKRSKTLGHLDAPLLEIRLDKTASEALDPWKLVSTIDGGKEGGNPLFVDFPEVEKEEPAKRARLTEAPPAVLAVLEDCTVKTATEQYGKYLGEANLTLQDRGDALRVLAEAAVRSAEATSDRPRQLVVFAGPSGSGKTRGGFEASVMWTRKDGKAALEQALTGKKAAVAEVFRGMDVLTLFVDLNNGLQYHSEIDKLDANVRLGARFAALVAGVGLEVLVHVPHQQLQVGEVLSAILRGRLQQLRSAGSTASRVLLVVHVDEWQLYMKKLVVLQNISIPAAVEVVKSMFSALNSFAFKPPEDLKDKFVLLPVLSGTPVLGGVRLLLTERMRRVDAPVPALSMEAAHALAVEVFEKQGFDRDSVRKMLKGSDAARVGLSDTGFWPRLLVELCTLAANSAAQNRDRAHLPEPLLHIKWAECAGAVSSQFLNCERIDDAVVQLVLTGEPIMMTTDRGNEVTSSIAQSIRDADQRGLVQLQETQPGYYVASVSFMLLRVWCTGSFPEQLLRPLAVQDQWTWDSFERLYAHFTAARLNALLKIVNLLERVVSLQEVVKAARGADALLTSKVRIRGMRHVHFENKKFMVNTTDKPPRTQKVSAAPAPESPAVMTDLRAGVFLAAPGNALFDMRYTLEAAGTRAKQAAVHVFVQDKHSGTTDGSVNMDTIGDWYKTADAATKQWRAGGDQTVLVYFTNRRLVGTLTDTFLSSRPRLLVVTRDELSEALTPALVSRGLIPSNARVL